MIFSVNTYTSFLGEFFCQYSLFLEVGGGDPYNYDAIWK